MGTEKRLHNRPRLLFPDTDLLSEVELGEGEGPQVDALLADLRLELLPELALHNHA